MISTNDTKTKTKKKTAQNFSLDILIIAPRLWSW